MKPKPKSDYENILISLSGLSPAVVTETVWGLATRERDPIVVDRVVVLTTKKGRKKLDEQVFSRKTPKSKSGWERMVAELKKRGVKVAGRLRFDSEEDVLLFPSVDGEGNADDINSKASNTKAADFIFDTIAGFTNSAGSENRRVLASLAGGRKTMSALMLSCMSLLARAQDKVFHVLVNEPYEYGVVKGEEPFIFPENRVIRFFDSTIKKEVPANAKDADISLIDLPFVKVMGFLGRLKVDTYDEAVKTTQKALQPNPILAFDFKTGRWQANGSDIGLTEYQSLLLAMVMAGVSASSFGDIEDVVAELGERGGRPGWIREPLDFLCRRVAKCDGTDASMKAFARSNTARIKDLRDALARKVGRLAANNIVPLKRTSAYPDELIKPSRAEIRKFLGLD